jgi:hypothetical protein
MMKVLAVLFALIAGMSPQSGNAADKHLIEFGWDEPTTGFLRSHIAEMETTPFDGCVFVAHANTADGKDAQFHSECWGRRAFTESELQPALDDLKATPFKRFRYNFLRVNVTPGDVDWFDDFTAITTNMRLAAHIAGAGGAKGILLDVEPYAAPLFDYRKQRDAKTKSFDQYAAQARRRGRELIAAFQQGCPDLQVFLTFGYTQPQLQIEATSGATLSSVEYGLLPAMLNGMLDGAAGKTQLIDGYEASYGYKTAADFAAAKKVTERSLAFVADRQQYDRHFAHGYGLWMDFNSHKHPWNTTDFNKNHFTPEAFQQTAQLALQTSDEYVWIYSQTPKWWSDHGRQNVPAEYERALSRAAAAVKTR